MTPPSSVDVRLTSAGRVLVVFAGAALLLSWALGGALALPAAGCVAVALLVPLATWLSARSLRIASPPGTTAFVGESFPLDVPIANVGRVFTARDVVVLLGAGRSAGGRGGERAGGERTGGYLPSLGPGAATTVDTTQRLLGRGRHRELQAALASTFPLGLARCRVVFAVPVDILVLPRLGYLRNVERITAHRHGMLFEGPTDRGDEQEFHGMREWRQGESLRRVHWRLSARRGRRLLREFRGEDRPAVHILLDRDAGSGVASRRASFERAVSLAATLAEHYLRRQHLVRLTLPGAGGVTLDRRRGRGGLFPVLSYLAEVTPLTREAAGDSLAEALEARRPDEITVVVRAGGPGRRPAARTPGTVVLDVDDEALSRTFLRTRPAGRAPLLGLAR